jgi:hypothetical protein
MAQLASGSRRSVAAALRRRAARLGPALAVERDLPALATGSYYVRSFRAEGAVAGHLAPLARDGVVRLCFKPPADPREPAGPA